MVKVRVTLEEEVMLKGDKEVFMVPVSQCLKGRGKKKKKKKPAIEAGWEGARGKWTLVQVLVLEHLYA